jgi:hypothetical protein
MFDVLTLFLIPIGGGIPAGVILAHQRGIQWPITSALYLISDMILACAFEPLMLLFFRQMKRSLFFARWGEAIKRSFGPMLMKYGVNPGPFSLILFSFGMDPMSGRVATHVAGHKFISGWLLAICGDMIFFAIVMASTLWLNNLLGDGTWAAVIVMVAMIAVPAVFRKIKEHRSRGRNQI